MRHSKNVKIKIKNGGNPFNAKHVHAHGAKTKINAISQYCSHILLSSDFVFCKPHPCTPPTPDRCGPRAGRRLLPACCLQWRPPTRRAAAPDCGTTNKSTYKSVGYLSNQRGRFIKKTSNENSAPDFHNQKKPSTLEEDEWKNE